jgi:type I restriction enzyme S subunit
MNSSCKSVGALSASKIEEGKFVPLGDLVRMVSGGTPSKNNPNYWIGSIPWVSAKDMKSFFISDSQDHVSESAVEAGARIVPEGTALLLTRGMTLLKDVPICVARTSLTFNQDVKALLAQSSLASDYLPYLLLGSKSRLLGLVDLAGHGTGRLSSDSLRALKVWLPPLSEQRAIASVLGALDDKIDLNRRMCQTLEEMARALFKSWFVDFDPVRAKMEGRDPGLPKEIADLFPSRLVNSELGPIPEGWRVAALDEVMDVNPPRALRKAAAAPHLDMGNMPTHGHCACDITERPYGSGARFVTGDTLLARITPCLENGKTAFVDFLPEGVVGWGSTEYIVIRPKPPTPAAMGYYLARTPRFREYAIQSMNGSSGRQRVPSEAVVRYRLPIAPEAVATGFGGMADPLMRRVRQATNESTTLAALRDTLLPKLISGELRVPASLGSMQEAAS